MQFEEPRWLLLALLAFLPFVRWRAERPSRFSSISIFKADAFSLAMLWFRKFFIAGALIAFAVALANPFSPGRMVTRFGEGASIVFVLDMSASMEMSFSGRSETKWAMSENVIERFVLRRCPKDRVGLIGFGSMPITFSNLTSDCDTFLKVLKSRGDDLFSTVIDWPLQNAVAMLREDGGDGAKMVVLVSDGAGSLDNKKELVRWFRQYDIKFYWIYINDGWPDTSNILLSELIAELGPAYADKFIIGTAGELERAFKKIEALKRGPVRYREWQPALSLRPLALQAALLCFAILLFFALCDIERRIGGRS